MGERARIPSILIVDDDTDILEIERALLIDEGFEILEASDLAGALQKIETRSPSVVLLDLVFPEDPEFGVHAGTAIREAYPEQSMFLVTSLNREYMTGLTKEHSIFDEIVSKPVDPSSLAKLLRTYCG